MSEEQRREDPLIRAIGDIRSDLLGWIDDRLEVLRRPTGESASCSDTPSVEEVRETAQRWRPAQEAAHLTEGNGEPVVRPTSDDARMRLDHLARRLDERLRQVKSPSIGSTRASEDLSSNERP